MPPDRALRWGAAPRSRCALHNVVAHDNAAIAAFGAAAIRQLDLDAERPLLVSVLLAIRFGPAPAVRPIAAIPLSALPVTDVAGDRYARGGAVLHSIPQQLLFVTVLLVMVMCCLKPSQITIPRAFMGGTRIAVGQHIVDRHTISTGPWRKMPPRQLPAVLPTT